MKRITVVYFHCVILPRKIIWCLSGNDICSNVWRRQFSSTHLFLFHNPVAQYEANIKLTQWKVTTFIAAPRGPPYWIVNCCYQIMSHEQNFVQWLVNGLFWSRLSKVITILDCISVLTRLLHHTTDVWKPTKCLRL